MSVILLTFHPEELDRADVDAIRRLAVGRRVVLTRAPEEIARLLGDVEIIAGFGMPYERLHEAPQLRWMQQWGAGVDWLMRHPAARAHPFVLTNASGVQAVPISEHVIGQMLMFARGLQHAVRAQQRHEWWRPDRQGVFELYGATLLVVGVGAIGSRIAALARAFGMRVEGIRRDAAVATPEVDALYGPGELAGCLARADIVVLCVPHTAETHHMIDAAALAQLKRTAYLINIGRGGTVDEAALAAALAAGQLAGAALDVFEAEPLPADSPLWGCDNVIITGHYAGNTPRYQRRAMAIFLENLRRYLAGEPLTNVVDKHLGY